MIAIDTIETEVPRPRFAGALRTALRAATVAVTVASATAPAPAAEPGASAVVMMYHRFGEKTLPSTNISIAKFEAHIAELQSGGYKVLGLSEIVDAVRTGKTLPDRAVGISIDDGYLSIYAEAWPRLKKAGFPFTVFVATDPIDQKLGNYMSWDQIKEMAAAGVTIGGHTVSHLHMPAHDAARNVDEIRRSNKRLAEMLGKAPEIFAYPYGESSLAVQKLMRESGYVAAFGQHSGVIGGDGNLFDLPRFAMNETYGELSRFKLAANALPLPVTDVTPADPLVGAVNPPAMGFTVADGIKGLDRLSCFVSHEGRARLERLGERRFEARVTTAFPRGRTRLNCTMPAGDGRWRWFGRQFYIPE